MHTIMFFYLLFLILNVYCKESFFFTNANISQQSLDYYKFSNTRNPLLIFVHGGLWVGGDKRAHQGWANYFNSVGFDVAILNYRLSSLSPIQTNDVSAALRFLNSKSEQLMFDQEQVSIAGHSAGAYEIAMLTLNPKTFQTDLKIKNFIGIEGF